MKRHAPAFLSIALVLCAVLLHARTPGASSSTTPSNPPTTSRDVLGAPVTMPSSWQMRSSTDGVLLWESPDHTANLSAGWAPASATHVSAGLSIAAATLANNLHDGRVLSIHADPTSGWFIVRGSIPGSDIHLRVTQTWLRDTASRRWRILSWTDTPTSRLDQSIRLQGTSAGKRIGSRA